VIRVVGLVGARCTVGGSAPRCVRCHKQVLRPVVLRMDRYALRHWTVTALSLGGRPVSWNVPSRAGLSVMDSSSRAVLGSPRETARPGCHLMPRSG